MAEGYQTDEEQIEQLKRWWRENGKSTVAYITIAIVAVFGWQGWQKQHQADMDAASAIYQNLLTVSQDTVTSEQHATANHLADTLKKDFSNTTYAQFAALYKAKFAVNNNDLVAAEQELRWVLDQEVTPELAAQTRLRLARVLSGQEKYDEALVQLQYDANGLAPLFEEERGDIYLVKGDTAGASAAYEKARELLRQQTVPSENPLLNLKIQQLNSALQSGSANEVDVEDSKNGDSK